MTFAEGYSIVDEEMVVEAAKPYLRIESTDGKSFTSLILHYRAPELRQITIERVSEPGEVKEWIDEELEFLQEMAGERVSGIRDHLFQSKEIIHIELGWTQLEDLAVVLSYEVARYIAQVAGGFIKADNNVWWQVENGVCIPL